MWTFIVAFVLLTAGHRAQARSLRGVLHHVCPDEQVVSQMTSSYSPINKDRQWRIQCKAVDSPLTCSWSGFYNLYEDNLRYNCPMNHVVAGIYSNFNSAHGDRSWNFLCCSAPNFITSECRETPMVNIWNEDFQWQLPGGNFLTGIQTHQNNNNGDHRWSFNYCKGMTQDIQTINSQILTVNQPMRDLLVEGDVFVPRTRNAIICENCIWSKSSNTVQVAYTMSDSFTSSEKTMIDNAINVFHMSTCVRFVPRNEETDYISIVKGSGCWSYVGRTGNLQQLSLDKGCVSHGIIQHEFIHALGFWHEQSRSDRDMYVQINLENIQTGRDVNFNQLETNNLDVPYDYSSVMHYAPTAFSRNGEDTITPLDPSAQIGQREGMTENDILKINKLYNCEDYFHQFGEWDNELTNSFVRECPSGQAVSGIASLRPDDQRDRLWAISCKAFKVTPVCHWSPIVNKLWESVNFNCGENEVIAGVDSTYDSVLQDRKWTFLCCSNPGFTTSNCQITSQINGLEEDFSWTVASDNFLTGVTSTFDDPTRDRRWTFSYCQGTSQ